MEIIESGISDLASMFHLLKIGSLPGFDLGFLSALSFFFFFFELCVQMLPCKIST